MAQAVEAWAGLSVWYSEQKKINTPPAGKTEDVLLQ
jgi:hypothetical protein